MAVLPCLMPERRDGEITRDALDRVILDEWEKTQAVHEEVQISDDIKLIPTVVSIASTIMESKQVYIRDKLFTAPINTFCGPLTKYRSLG